MLTDADLRKIRKLLAPLATRKDIGSSKNLGALWEKYAAIKIKLDKHEKLIRELKKAQVSEKEKEGEHPIPIMNLPMHYTAVQNDDKTKTV
ncbi:MAG: hypothetical protein A3G61_02360 [Candidatus Taylorbacteria bacterium RIFCSPLOWO2_12_FULL_49_67]|nr:MAG: hypothetical protein A3G61_02360 [Candidatus Taylorbacteria bacterium RIFCSPLOWO2_12_FULL_49_67]